MWWRGWESRSKLSRADWVRMKLVPQFESQVPDPLGDQLPALLSPGGVAAPTVWIDLLVFIRERRFKGAAMQIQLDDIAGGECLLRQGGKKELVDDACPRDAHWALLFTCRMRGHHDAAEDSLRPDRHVWAIVEAASNLAFGTLLELIGGQVQTRLKQRMIEHTVFFATGHKGEASEIGEHGPGAILSIKP